MTESEVLDKIHLLPTPVQQHLFLYVDFLFNTYFPAAPEKSAEAPAKDFFDKHELTEAGKALLDQRAEQALAHPEKRLPWREAREKIHKKHNLAL